MNKILILLSLIYLISCKLSCISSEKEPENSEDCYNRALDNEDNDVCCYVKINIPLKGNMSLCREFEIGINKEFIKQTLAATYSQFNSTLEDFSCPTKEKSDDSSKEDDSSTKNCSCIMDEKNYKNCFSKTLQNETNNYCCFVLMSINGENQGGCIEIEKNKSIYDMKQKILNDMKVLNMSVVDLKCPSNEEEEKEKKEEKENSPQGNTSNKGFYIKSGFVLIFAFLF